MRGEIKNRIKKTSWTLICLLLCLTGCGSNAQPETVETAETVEETEPEAEVPEETEEEEPKEEPLPVYEEDTNVYGNTVGNLYNEGAIVYDETSDCLYFYNSYEDALVKTSAATGETVLIADGLYVYLNLYEGKLYGVEIGEEGEALNIQMYDPQAEKWEVLREGAVGNFQVVNGDLYFTDAEDNTLHRLNAESGEEEVLLEEEIYFPVVYKDRIIFQMDGDKESLYSVSIDGEDPVKLNDMRSYYPLVYRDKIYYRAIDDEENPSLRRMNLDGSEDEAVLEERLTNINLSDGKCYYTTGDTANKLNYIDLEEGSMEIQELNLGDPLRKALKETYGVQEIQVKAFSSLEFAGDFALFMCGTVVDGTEYMDEYLYRMDTGEVLIVPEFCMGESGDNVALGDAALEDISPEELEKFLAALAVEEGGGQTAEAKGQASSDKEAQALAVAQSIADSIPAGSDLSRVRAAAAAVADYCARATYTSSDPDYQTAYGVFCKGVYTCAGSTRALGMVLDCMGYSWTHANAHQWTHQWCELTMDGQAGWADGMGGIADYGACPFATGGSYTGPDGTTYYVPQ